MWPSNPRCISVRSLFVFRICRISFLGCSQSVIVCPTAYLTASGSSNFIRSFAIIMHFPTSPVTLVAALLLNSIAPVNAAPQSPPSSLTSKIQAYLASQGVNATIPASGSTGSDNNTSLTCGILNAYRDGDLVTPQDGQAYILEAEQHWYVHVPRPSPRSSGSLRLTRLSVSGHLRRGNIRTVFSSLPRFQKFNSL